MKHKKFYIITILIVLLHAGMSCGYEEEKYFLNPFDPDMPAILTINPANNSKIDGTVDIVITYSEAVTGADSAGNYAFSGAGAGTLSVNSATNTGANQYTLDVTGVPGDSSIVLTISNVQDAAGNALSGNTVNYNGWWNINWGYRQRITIDNTGGGALTNYEARVNIGSGNSAFWSHVESTGYDIRFTDNTGSVSLSNYRETFSYAGTSALLWIKIPVIPAGGTETIYMYYGNAAASDISDMEAVFIFADDFEGAFDTAKWTASGAASVSGGALTVTTGSVYSDAFASSQNNKMCEASVRWTGAASGYSGLCIANAQFTSGSNGGSNKLVYLITGSGSFAVTSWAANGTAASYNILSSGTEFTAITGTWYTIGYVVGAANVGFYNNYIQTNNPAGTWTGNFYLWLGYFSGSTSGTTDITDLAVDWVRVRQYANPVPTVSFGSEE